MVIGLTAALGVVVLASGHILIGALITAMAMMRAVALLAVQRRVRRLRARRVERRAMIRQRLAARRARV
jgi:hypothetical protein